VCVYDGPTYLELFTGEPHRWMMRSYIPCSHRAVRNAIILSARAPLFPLSAASLPVNGKIAWRDRKTKGKKQCERSLYNRNTTTRFHTSTHRHTIKQLPRHESIAAGKDIGQLRVCVRVRALTFISASQCAAGVAVNCCFERVTVGVCMCAGHRQSCPWMWYFACIFTRVYSSCERMSVVCEWVRPQAFLRNSSCGEHHPIRQHWYSQNAKLSLRSRWWEYCRDHRDRRTGRGSGIPPSFPKGQLHSVGTHTAVAQSSRGHLFL